MGASPLSTTNTDALRRAFIERVLACRPTSVLDVGAGAGTLVQACRAAGIRALGIEPAGGGEGVLRADATHLPAGDESWDWVTLRHVPHHLRRPAEAFAEAWRVARVGLWIAEPCFGRGSLSEGERLGLAADRWLKRLDRRRGVFHADILGSAELAALLPPGARVREEFIPGSGRWTAAELAAEREHSARGLTPFAEEESEWKLLVSAAEQGRVARVGSLLLEVRRE